MPQVSESVEATQMMPQPNVDTAEEQRAVRPIVCSPLGLSGDTNELLAHRLRNAALALAFGGWALMLLGTFLRQPHWTAWLPIAQGAHIASTVLVSIIAWRLCVSCSHTLQNLRIVEFVIFGSMAISAFFNVLSMQLSVAQDGMLTNPVPPWILFPFVYALYIPNTWKRAAGILSLFALLGLASLWLPPLLSEQVRSVLQQHATLQRMLVQETFAILFCTGVAAWGIKTIRTLRQQVFEAQQVGQYKLKRLLGRGGMGEVHLAEHVLLRRPCAVKLISRDKVDDPNALARFEREVQATAKLTHWNTVEIYDYGRTDDDVFYYVMEYLPGLNLQEVTELNGPLPPERVIHLLTQACDALSEAHAAGLVHRDIKPANIYAASRGGVYDIVKLLDFGLVRERNAKDDDLSLTQVGTITGSPLFLSPEQATGEPVDARSDIYSLGVVGYYLLTGRTPFASDNAIKVIMSHVNEPPPPIESHGAAIPHDLADIVMKCLEKSPDDRFQTVLELQRALRKCELANVWTREKAEMWWQLSGCPHKKSLDAEAMELAGRS
ncbi:MAG: protein kinase [Planctomycetaceae bacterium]|nr:protein kinase [Planctomycetaceae bacterium]